MKLELVATATFGLEAVVRREIEALGYKVIKTEDGRVTYMGDERAIVRSNLWLRTADRVYVRMGEFRATEFEELFQQTKALEWESIIPLEGAFPVVGGSVKSVLHSVPACQKIIKKAVSMRLSEFYCREMMPETGAEYRIRFIAHKDQFLMLLDTSGAGLHKRGYRTLVGKAPISETLAAALIKLTPWHADRVLVDPFCGSGTFPIEAALIGANIAPGMNREFAASSWSKVAADKLWKEAYAEARDLVKTDVEMNIQGYDLDPEIVKCAMANAKAAGVEKHIHFQARDVAELRHPKHYGFIITNPPYGERLEEKAELPELYKTIGESFKRLEDWSMFLITSYEEAEKYIGKKADKNRKIYNGMIKSYFYSFMGPKPPKKN